MAVRIYDQNENEFALDQVIVVEYVKWNGFIGNFSLQLVAKANANGAEKKDTLSNL